MVMLSTSHAATTGMLAVLSYTAVAGGDMAAAVLYNVSWEWTLSLRGMGLGRGIRRGSM